jgi:hypothetical protein
LAGEPTAGCGLRAFGVVRAGPEALAALRQKPGPPGAAFGRVRPNLLKFSDEQTVVSLAAVLDAVHRFGLGDLDFAGWGVVAAPRWLGRAKTAGGMNKFHREGPATMSAMLVPHTSLHAVSGTISQALKVYGPNFGTGSGPGHLAEGLLAALSLVAEGELPGLWLTLSQWDPEPSPDVQGRVPPSCVCYAAALALVPVPAGAAGPGLRLVQPAPGGGATCPPPDVRGLADFLDGRAPAPGWRCPLDWGGWVELTGTLPRPPGAGSQATAEAQA